MASSSSKLSNRTITRLYSVAKHEKGGDAKKRLHLKDEIEFALEKSWSLDDMSKWSKVSSMANGIDRSMIPQASQIVLNILRRNGHQSYLVGGCVRDLLLKRVPKDFDVITTANLKQIKKQFHQSVIVGQRFPVCVVNIKGQAIEVSSFDTVANGGSVDKSNNHLMQKHCSKTDLLLWKNSMHRDFTVNSLFFDLHKARIYDYNGGMTDLKSLELRTLIPAHLSFQEDCARILRGLRIAARLNMSVSNDTATAIHRLSSSVLTLAKSRIMMEINYMLSYGAAQPSLCLLDRFNLLQVFFPCHAAILYQQTIEGCTLSSSMLMKLFSNLDNMVGCDRPSHCSLWVSLMAFHLALNTKPQEPLVIWTFSSLLCTKNWSRSLEFARESAQRQAFSAPEISKAFGHMEDEELASKVSELASLVATSIGSLTREQFLRESREQFLRKSISRFKDVPSSVLVFVSEKCGRETARLFSMFDADIKSYTAEKEKVNVDYQALKKGEVRQTRFVLGQIIMNTMSGKVNKACANSNPNQNMFSEDKSHTKELLDQNLHISLSVHATEKPANENKKFDEYLTKPSHRVLESVEIVNHKNSLQNLDDYFMEELGPACTQGKLEELMSVAKTDIKENIAKQKRSEAQDHVLQSMSKQEANNPSQKMEADKVVQQKMLNVKQVIETLQLQTEIKFSDNSLKKGNHTAVKMVEPRQETTRKERGDTKQTSNEIGNRKPLSSLFTSMTVEHNTTKKVVGMFNGNHHGPSDQTKDVMANSDKRLSEMFRKSADCNLVEALEHLSGSRSSDEELLEVERTSKNKTTWQQNVSGKLQDETESLIAILGDKQGKSSKNQVILDTLSHVIKEKFLKDEDCMPDEMRDATDGDNLQSVCVSDQKNSSLKRKLVETGSKSHEKPKTGFSTTNRAIAPSVDDDTKELHVDSRCWKNENVSKSLEADTTSKQNLSDTFEPGTKTKTGRRASRKSENMVKPSDAIKKALNEETTDANRKPATKKRKTSQLQSKLKDEVNALTKVNNNDAPAPAPVHDTDADITEALGESMPQKGDEDSKETKTVSKPKKRRANSKKQETTEISSYKIHDNSHTETVDDNDEIQQQTTAKKKRKPRKTLSKSKDEVNDQSATDKPMQVKSENSHTVHP